MKEKKNNNKEDCIDIIDRLWSVNKDTTFLNILGFVQAIGG